VQTHGICADARHLYRRTPLVQTHATCADARPCVSTNRHTQTKKIQISIQHLKIIHTFAMGI